MVYMDTSVLVALLTHEANAERIARWYEAETRPLISSDWCVPEFASALALKERTGQLTRKQGNAAWKVFDEFCSAGLRLLPLGRDVFAQAAHLVRESKHGLRAGDSLHLALALGVHSEAFFTLDARLEACARQNKLSLVTLS
jgi:uncharacterized protein